MRPAGFRNFLLLASSLLLAGLSAVPQSFSPSLRSGPGAACRLTRAESERRCRAPGQPPGGALCHGRGRCDCGVCICHVSEPGVYFGPLCECHEWVCETYDGSTCAGKGVALSPRRGPARLRLLPLRPERRAGTAPPTARGEVTAA
uniref:Integrin beta-like protein 1 n=1 Tax=Camelus bactrianus TaxID=9837 RepID=A0A9W3GVU8_CAMBA|nr:integrin beta-like protein 1 [Camelus bactrianus]